METNARSVVEAFVQALAARDRAAVEALYAPGARFEVHVPGWDTLVEDPQPIGELLHDFFLGRDGFRVARHQIVAEGDGAALNFDLGWRDAHSGGACDCFQAHAFEIAAGRIALHRMYCAGVRVTEAPEA